MKSPSLLQLLLFIIPLLSITSCCDEKIRQLEIQHVEEIQNKSTEIQNKSQKIDSLKNELKNYGKILFDGKYVTGYVVLQPKFGYYGMLELHEGDSHLESFLAIYDMNDLEDLTLGKKYFVKVQSFNGIPKVYQAKSNIDSNELYNGTPFTNLDYHILSDHGEGAGWHKYGHRINVSNSFNSVTSKLKIKIDETTEVEYIVPVTLIEMAQLISDDSHIDTIYYELNSDNTEFIVLDTVHRHGNLTYKF